MKKFALGFMIFVSGVKSFGLAKIMECRELRQSPANVILQVTLKDEKTVNILVLRTLAGISQRLKEVADIVTPLGSKIVKSAFSSPDGGKRLKLAVTFKEERTTEGDEGFLASFSEATSPNTELVCWFSKQARPEVSLF